MPLPRSAARAPNSKDEVRDPPHRLAERKRDEAVELLREAEANLRFNTHERLTFIHLEHRSAPDRVFTSLPWLRSVDRLYLADTGVTDAQLHWVGLMPGLKRLSLWGNPVTDQGLAELSALWNLEVLDVHDTDVTAAGLCQLRLLDRLTTLIVPQSIDLNELACFRNRPNLEIIRK